MSMFSKSKLHVTLLASITCFVTFAGPQLQKSSAKELVEAKQNIMKIPYVCNLPVIRNAPPWLPKMIYVYISTDRWTFQNDPETEKEYLANYKDKNYVKFLLTRKLRKIYDDDSEFHYFLSTGLNIHDSKMSPEECARYALEVKESLQMIRHRINLVEQW